MVNLRGICVGLILCSAIYAQDGSGGDNTRQPGTLAGSRDGSASNVAPARPESKRIFGIVPNYRSSPSLHPYVAISAGQKFKIATQDAFDRGTVILAAAFAGEAQLTNANRSFGQGGEGFGKYFAASYADYAIGDYLTEGVFPTLFHQDPRYFRRGEGSAWSRLAYAAGQILLTHNDEGEVKFNYSELVGNSTAVAISQSYYSDNRDAKDAGVKLANQLGVDAASNVLKEFWPDLQRKFSHRH